MIPLYPNLTELAFIESFRHHARPVCFSCLKVGCNADRGQPCACGGRFERWPHPSHPHYGQILDNAAAASTRVSPVTVYGV